MRILLIAGHGAGDPGAVANGLREADLTIEQAQLLQPRLAKHVNVTLYPLNRNAFQDIRNGQWQVGWDFDYVFELHFNAGGGTGSEIFVTTKETKTIVEQAVLAELSAVYRNRGVKVTDFLVIKTCKDRGISSALLETCFIDNKNDVDVYLANKEEIADMITNGIVKGFGLSTSTTPQPAPQPSPTPTKSIEELANEVIAGKWGVNPARRESLLAQGYDADAVQARVNQIFNQGASQPQPTVSYYPAFNSNSIVDGLKSINVDSSITNRQRIAVANGITNYSGTASQNTQLLNLAKQGKLKKV